MSTADRLGLPHGYSPGEPLSPQAVYYAPPERVDLPASLRKRVRRTDWEPAKN
jgi:hypothetical protein